VWWQKQAAMIHGRYRDKDKSRPPPLSGTMSFVVHLTIEPYIHVKAQEKICRILKLKLVGCACPIFSSYVYLVYARGRDFRYDLI